MRIRALILPTVAAWAIAASSAVALPEQGFYYQPAPGTSGNIQATAEQGVLEADYVPILPGPIPSQVLRLAARAPLPLIDGPVVLRGYIGWQQQWAYYQTYAEDTAGGIEAGVSGALPLANLVIPQVGDRLKPFTLNAYVMGTRLIMAKAQGAGIPLGNVILPEVGAGVGYVFPAGGEVYVGLESWTMPIELGTGAQLYSGKVAPFSGLLLGYRW